MSDSDRQRWNSKYSSQSTPESLSPDDWLIKQIAGTSPGQALDLACGLGHNAIWLAQQGWRVDAVDISGVGLKLAEQLASNVGCRTVSWIECDLDTFEARGDGYDLIVVFRFLDRQRLPRLIESALRPGGMLVYETFSQAQLARNDNHLRNPAFTLASGELPSLFSDLTIVAYKEIDLPHQSVAQLSARSDRVIHAPF